LSLELGLNAKGRIIFYTVIISYFTIINSRPLSLIRPSNFLIFVNCTMKLKPNVGDLIYLKQ
jgi:hypothetical protein